MSSSSVNNVANIEVSHENIYIGKNEFEMKLASEFGKRYLKKHNLSDNGNNYDIVYKTNEDLKAENINVCGINNNTGVLEVWAQPIDTCEPLTDGLQINSIQRQYFNNLFRRNYEDYEDNQDDDPMLIINDRIKFLSNGIYNRQYSVLNSVQQNTGTDTDNDSNQAGYLDICEIVLTDGMTRFIPYFHPNTEKPITVARNLGQWGPNFAIDVVLTCGENIICILRRPRDSKGSVTSRGSRDRTITALKAAGTPASIAAVGGMLETLAGPLTAFKELIEEAWLTPEDVLGDACPELLKTRHWIRRNESTGKPFTLEQVLELLPEDKKNDAEAFYDAYLDHNSFLYQTTVFGAKITKYINADFKECTNDVTTAELLRTGNYERLGQILRPIISDEDDYEYRYSRVSVDEMTDYIEEAINFLTNGLPIAFDLQVMEEDKRNTSVSFMVSSGLRIEIPESTFKRLKDIYSISEDSKSAISNSESAGLAAFSAYELAKYYDNPELYKSSFSSLDCDKSQTIEVINVFTNMLTPVWRTHLDTLIMISHNIISKQGDDSRSDSLHSQQSQQSLQSQQSQQRKQAEQAEEQQKDNSFCTIS